MSEVSIDVLVERIDNLSNQFGQEIKGVKEQLTTVSSSLVNLKDNFPTRSELQATESRLKTPIEKVTNVVFGPDGSDGLVTKISAHSDNISTLKTVIGIYVTIATAIFSFIIWKLFSQ